jgi:hypothetical protein
MAKLNWFLSLKNMAKSDETAKQLLNSINSAESEELKEKAKIEAREYVESFAESEPETPEKPAEPEQTIEIKHIETESEVKQADKELEIDLDSNESTGERPEPQSPMNNSLIERIRRRKQIAEENARKRRNQPITLSEQKAAAIEKGKEVMARNALMAERRKELHALIEKQMAERKANDTKNMVGVLDNLLRELKLNTRLEVICKKYHYTRKDLETLKANNPAGWQACLNIREKLEKEMDMYIHE